jgi:hypothetical protein
MTERNGVSATDLAPLRIAEDRAAKILERAAALDAKRNSEIEIDQLREAAADAGISREAFEEALREQAEQLGAAKDGKRGAGTTRAGYNTALASTDVAHYAALLRDVLGEDGEVRVSDVIEWRDDEGLTVTVSPSSGGVTAAVTAEGRLRSKLKGVILPALLPLAFFFVMAFDEEEALVGFICALIVTILSATGTFFTHQREQKALRKKAERIRRQLQRLLAPAAE